MAYDNKGLIIYDRAYHLCLWLYPATSNYPRKLRGLAIQTANLATQILLDITKANAERSKTATVSGIVLAVRQLKTLLRLAMELKGLGFNQYEHAATLTGVSDDSDNLDSRHLPPGATGGTGRDLRTAARLD